MAELRWNLTNEGEGLVVSRVSQQSPDNRLDCLPVLFPIRSFAVSLM